MDTIEDGWLAIYLAVIPLTAIVIAVLFGVVFLSVWVLGLGARLVFQAMNRSHPNSLEEEID